MGLLDELDLEAGFQAAGTTTRAAPGRPRVPAAPPSLVDAIDLEAGFQGGPVEAPPVEPVLTRGAPARPAPTGDPLRMGATAFDPSGSVLATPPGPAEPTPREESYADVLRPPATRTRVPGITAETNPPPLVGLLRAWRRGLGMEPQTPVADPADIARAQIEMEARANAETPEAYVERVSGQPPTVPLRATKGFARGAMGVGEGLGQFGRLAGHVTGSDVLSATAKEFEDAFGSEAAKYKVSNPNFFDHLAEGAGSMAAFLVPVAGQEAAIATLPLKAGRMVQAVTAATTEAMSEAGNVYADLTAKGMDKNEAAKRAGATFAANEALLTVTNKLGLFSEAGKAGWGQIKRVLKTAALEGPLQEGPQQIIQDVASGQPIDWSAVGEQSAIGTLVGGGASVATDAAERRRAPGRPIPVAGEPTVDVRHPAIPEEAPVLPDRVPLSQQTKEVPREAIHGGALAGIYPEAARDVSRETSAVPELQETPPTEPVGELLQPVPPPPGQPVGTPEIVPARTPEGELPVVYEHPLEAGETPPGTVPGLREREIAGAPPGLQQPAAGGLVVPPVPSRTAPRREAGETGPYGVTLDLADPDSIRAFVMAHGGLQIDPARPGEMAMIPPDVKNNTTGAPWDVIAQQAEAQGVAPLDLLNALTDLGNLRRQKRERVESERRALKAEQDEATGQARIKALPLDDQVRILSEQSGRAQEAIRAEIETQQAQDATFEDTLAFFDQAALEREALTRETAGAAGAAGEPADVGTGAGGGPAGRLEPGAALPEPGRSLPARGVPERSAVGLPAGAGVGGPGQVDLGRGRRRGRAAERALSVSAQVEPAGRAAAAGSAPGVAGARRAPGRRARVEEQARIPGTAAAAVPSTLTRATAPQADVTTAPLFGQERAAREAEVAAAQGEIPAAKPKYSSTQVNLPDSLANDMRAWAQEHIPAEALAQDGIEQDPHVTVKYGLHTNNAAKIAKLLEGRDNPLTFTLGKMDVFEQDDHDVLLVKVKGPGLRALNAKIADNLRTTDDNEYVPHATLAYVKKGAGAQFVGDATFDGREVQAAVISFSPKEGAATDIPLVAEPAPEPTPVAADREGEAGFVRLGQREVVPGNPEIKEMNKRAENKPDLRTRIGKVKERIITTQLNRFFPLKYLGDMAKKAGVQFQEGSTPMEWAEITNARAAGRFDAWLTSAERVMAPIQKGGLEEVLNDYLTMKQMDKRIRDLHTEAPEVYTAQGRNTETDTLVNPRGFDKAKITEGLRDLKGRLTPEQHTAVTTAADQLWALNREVLDAAHEAGVVSDEVHEKIVGRGDDYVPFQVLDYLADLDHASRSPGPRPLNVRYQDYLRKMAGTERDVANVIGASVEKAMKGFMLAERNLAVKQVTKLSTVLPDVIQKVPGDTFRVPGDQEILSVFENGSRENYAVPKDIAATMLFLDEVQLDRFGKFLQYAASPLRAGATSLNVGFSVTNFLRDIKRMLYYSKYGAKSPIDIIRAAYNWGEGVAAVYNKSPEYLEALQSGSLYTTVQKDISGMEQLRRRVGRLSGDQGITVSGLKDKIVTGLSYINTLIEEGPKMASFIRGKRQGASGQELAYEVANYGGSPNFSRAGTWGKQLNVLSMFYNARLQGTAGNIRRLRETKGKAAGKVAMARLGLILAPMTALAYFWNAQFDDDHGLEEIPDRDKQKFFVLLLDDRFSNMLGMGPALYQHADGSTRRKHLKIAKEEGEQVLVPILEAGLDVVRGKDRETLAKMSADLLGNLSPVSINIKDQSPRGWAEGITSGALAGLNPVIRIPAELGMNWSAYRQGPIVPRALAENVLPAEQVRPTTSPAMIQVANILGVSPIKLQYAVTSATGGLGQGVLDEVDKRLLGKAAPETQSDYERLARTPVLGRLLGTGGNDQDNKTEEELYTISDEAKRTRGSMKVVETAGNEGRMEQLIEDRPLVLQSMAGQFQKLTKGLADVRQMQVWATHVADVDPDTKREIMAVLAEERHSILEVFRALKDGTGNFSFSGGGLADAETQADAETVPTGG